MIQTVLMVSLYRLLHNRIELMLTFLVPIAFFSIFALIFDGGVGGTQKIKVVAVDQSETPQSLAVLSRLEEMESLKFVSDQLKEQKTAPEHNIPLVAKAKAADMVRRGTAAIAIVLNDEAGQLAAELLSDTSDQVAPQIVAALVQRAMLAASPASAPPRAVMQVSASDSGPPGTGPTMADSRAATNPASGPIPFTLPTVQLVDVMGGSKSNPVISMYAAGIAVMFLLFGATGGGGVLLEERENQTLDRLLTTGLSMDDLLLGKWFYLTLLGVVQTSVMFVWGQLVFGIDLWGHLDGFVIMTVVTSGAAAAFGLLLATICKTRGQLNGLSVIVILTMSALGGSMVPRYVMSQSLRDAGLWTFNAWALDGYDKVFWRELPAVDLWPQMGVLMLSGTAFLFIARLFAVRWETD